MKHVKATGLSSVFKQGLNPVVFTEDAVKKGVNNNSIIYITCGPDDVENFGIQFVEGSRWIWTQGEWYANVTNPITDNEIDEAVLDDIISDGLDEDVDLQSAANKLRAIPRKILQPSGQTEGGALKYILDPNEYCTIYDVQGAIEIHQGAMYSYDKAMLYICRIQPLEDNVQVTFVWNTSLKWFGGQVPTFSKDKIYEISILDGVAMWVQV